MHYLKTSVYFFSVSVFLLTGCNNYKEVAPVTGKVTLKGEPVAGLSVFLSPPDGRPSVGRTDVNGNYVMQYTHTKWGVKVGTVNVSFDPYSSEPTGDPNLCEPSPLIEKIPRKYFSDFQSFQVEPKANVLDINIE